MDPIQGIRVRPRKGVHGGAGLSRYGGPQQPPNPVGEVEHYKPMIARSTVRKSRGQGDTNCYPKTKFRMLEYGVVIRGDGAGEIDPLDTEPGGPWIIPGTRETSEGRITSPTDKNAGRNRLTLRPGARGSLSGTSTIQDSREEVPNGLLKSEAPMGVSLKRPSTNVHGGRQGRHTHDHKPLIQDLVLAYIARRFRMFMRGVDLVHERSP